MHRAEIGVVGDRQPFMISQLIPDQSRLGPLASSVIQYSQGDSTMQSSHPSIHPTFLSFRRKTEASKAARRPSPKPCARGCWLVAGCQRVAQLPLPFFFQVRGRSCPGSDPCSNPRRAGGEHHVGSATLVQGLMTTATWGVSRPPHKPGSPTLGLTRVRFGPQTSEEVGFNFGKRQGKGFEAIRVDKG